MSPVVALVSGGVDSAVLVAHLLQEGSEVHPMYVQVGSAWEPAEQRHLERYLAAIAASALRRLKVVSMPVVDIYGNHWSVEGEQAPGYDAPDEDMYLPGRNLLLVSKAAVYCGIHRIGRIALGLLAGNPFPDATDAFLDALSHTVSLGLGAPVHIERPFSSMHKADVIRLGKDLPLELTFSCVQPAGQLHCGDCNKCAERQRGFRAVGLPDRTPYARTNQPA